MRLAELLTVCSSFGERSALYDIECAIEAIEETQRVVLQAKGNAPLFCRAFASLHLTPSTRGTGLISRMMTGLGLAQMKSPCFSCKTPVERLITPRMTPCHV